MNENIKCTKTINEHTGWVNSLCLLRDNRFASCSNDFTIKIFNSSTFECEVTIKTDKLPLLSICQLDNDDILVSSNKKTILSYSIQDNVPKLTFINKSAHDGWITKVISLPNNRYASCSNDETIKIWSSAPYSNTPIKILGQHSEYINSILYIKNKDLLISGSYDYSLIIWNASNYQSVFAIEGVYCCDKNSMKQIDDDRIIVGGNNHIYIINVNKGIIEHDVNEKIGYVNSFIKLNEDLFICGLFGGVYFYNINTKQGKKEKSEHTKTVNDFLLLNNNCFISCSEDHTIKVYTC